MRSSVSPDQPWWTVKVQTSDVEQWRLWSAMLSSEGPEQPCWIMTVQTSHAEQWWPRPAMLSCEGSEQPAWRFRSNSASTHSDQDLSLCQQIHIMRNVGKKPVCPGRTAMVQMSGRIRNSDLDILCSSNQVSIGSVSGQRMSWSACVVCNLH